MIAELVVEVVVLVIKTLAFGIVHFFSIWRINPQWARASSFTRFLDHTQRRTTVGGTPLDEWLPPDNTQHSKQTDSHAPGGIQTHDLSSWVAAGTGIVHFKVLK
jgi:hypothetical protein